MYTLQVRLSFITSLIFKHVLKITVTGVSMLTSVPRFRMRGGILPRPTLHVKVHNALFIFIFCEQNRLCDILGAQGGCSEDSSGFLLNHRSYINTTFYGTTQQYSHQVIRHR
jgi:hypothetical protein